MDRIFIDVREPFEFARGHVAGAINIPPAELMRGAKALDNVPKDTELGAVLPIRQPLECF